MLTNVKVSGKFQHYFSIAEKIIIIVLSNHRVAKDNEKTELNGSKDSYTLPENEFSVDFDNFPSIS